MLVRANQSRRQRGVSLIEVLVAILIASLGVLAMAGLLATSARFGKTAEFRSVSSLMAADIADRMRANRAGLLSYSLLNATLTTDLPAQSAACATTGVCTAAEMAGIDLAEWQATLFHNLPSGTGYISVSDAANQVLDVWVIWEDPDSLGVGFSANAGAAVNAGCPPNFTAASGLMPRCMFFRVGL